ncbi:MAG TPA: hypothetical protein VJ652_07605 [Noviherbaspirillum sp.]|nr:hypothetical protein [Noviherbaspirillum sp.]
MGRKFARFEPLRAVEAAFNKGCRLSQSSGNSDAGARKAMAVQRIVAATMLALLSGIAYSQGTTPPGRDQAASAPAQQPQFGPGGGPRGRMMMRFSDANTPGWSMMTPEERSAHREKMAGVKTVEECRAYHDEHRKLMEARAKERGTALRPRRGDPCGTMQRRGWLQQ